MKDFLKNIRKKLKGRYPKNKKFEHQTSKRMEHKDKTFVKLCMAYDTPDTHSVTIIHNDGLSLEQRLI